MRKLEAQKYSADSKVLFGFTHFTYFIGHNKKKRSIFDIISQKIGAFKVGKPSAV